MGNKTLRCTRCKTNHSEVITVHRARLSDREQRCPSCSRRLDARESGLWALIDEMPRAALMCAVVISPLVIVGLVYVAIFANKLLYVLPRLNELVLSDLNRIHPILPLMLFGLIVVTSLLVTIHFKYERIERWTPPEPVDTTVEDPWLPSSFPR